MTKAKAPPRLVAFDAAKYLGDDEAIAEYMAAVLEASDPDLLLLALGDVARAKGMTQVARDAGLSRESLYKALAPGAKPRALRDRHARRQGPRRQVHGSSSVARRAVRSDPPFERTVTGMPAPAT